MFASIQEVEVVLESFMQLAKSGISIGDCKSLLEIEYRILGNILEQNNAKTAK